MRDDRVERLPRPRGAAGAAVHDEVLGALGDLGVEVVHQHPHRGLLRPRAAGQLGSPRGAHLVSVHLLHLGRYPRLGNLHLGYGSDATRMLERPRLAPVPSARWPPTEPSSRSGPETPWITIRVLIADDEPRAPRSPSRSSSPRGTGRARRARPADAEEAIPLAESDRPDVAIVDVKMPAGGGPRRGARDLARLPGHPRDRAVRARGPRERAGDAPRRRGGLPGQGHRRRRDRRTDRTVAQGGHEPVGRGDGRHRRRARDPAAPGGDRAEEDRALRGDIERFVSGDGVWMVFQPIVDLETPRAASAFEALARFGSIPMKPPDRVVRRGDRAGARTRARAADAEGGARGRARSRTAPTSR